MKTLLAPATLIAAFSLGALSTQIPPQTPPDNEELKQMYQVDQSDRAGKMEDLDWKKINANDLAHQTRVAEMLKADLVQTGTDYYHAAMIYQHAGNAQGYKLAHELSMIAAAKGNEPAKWLTAASWDRFLRSMKENQRFATQYFSKDMKTFELDPVDPEPTDSMRKALNCPTLDEAKRRANDF